MIAQKVLDKWEGELHVPFLSKKENPMIKVRGFINFYDFCYKIYFPIRELEIRQTTLENYKIIIKNLNHIKYKNLLLISQKDILKELSDWETTRSREVLKVLNPIFKMAVQMRYRFKNPCEGIKISVSKKEIKFFTKEEIDLILEEAKSSNPRIYVAILISLYAGLRRGEVAGLRKESIDFENCTIDINQQIVTPPYSTSQISQLKTKASYRKIKVNKFVLDEIRNLGNNEYAIPGKNTPFITPALITANFRQLQKDIGLKKPKRFHDLRVTHATFLISKGVDVKTVSRRLGHSSTDITMEIYTAYIQEKDSSCIKVLEDLIDMKY